MYFLLVLLAVFICSRGLIRTLPGDPIETLIAETGTKIDPKILRKELGLDEPFLKSLFNDVKKWLQGNLGNSILSGEPIAPRFKKSFFITLTLTLLTLFFTFFLSLILGIFSAYSTQNPKWKIWDQICTLYGALMAGVPSAWLGPALLYLLAVKLPLFPIPSVDNLGIAAFLLPSFTLSLSISGVWSRLIRERVKESFFNGSVPGARARGIPEWKVVLKYGLLPVSGSLIAFYGTQTGALLGGAFITEMVFNLHGLGTLLVESVLTRDYSVFEICAFFTALFALVGTFLGSFVQNYFFNLGKK